MEPTEQGSHAQGEIVLVRTRPVYALCNVHYLLLEPLINGYDNPMRFVNAAGGVSRKGTAFRPRNRAGGMLVTRSVLEETPED